MFVRSSFPVHGETHRWRVLLSVTPPLLSDLLVRELPRDDVDFVVVGGGSSAVEAARRAASGFDIAITTGPPPRGVQADTVLRLPDDAGVTTGSLHTERGVRLVEIGKVSAIAGLLEHVCPRHARGQDRR
jgi:hypothetical protein